jgi:uncharacterized protein YndB with AHSA1/START domain
MSHPDVVTVRMDLACPPADVYPYWTDPGRYARWMGRTVRLSARPGGEYFVQMPDGFAAMGTFVELEQPRLVEFTWGWAPGAGQAVLTGAQPDELLPPGASRVRVTLDDNHGGSTLTLEHHDLPDEALRAGHFLAWRTYLARLAVVASGGDPGPEPHAGAAPDPDEPSAASGGG